MYHVRGDRAARDGRVHLVRVLAGGTKPTSLQEARVVEATSYLEFLKKERNEPFESVTARSFTDRLFFGSVRNRSYQSGGAALACPPRLSR